MAAGTFRRPRNRRMRDLHKFLLPIDWAEFEDELSPDLSQKTIAKLKTALRERLPTYFGVPLAPPEFLRFDESVQHWERCAKLARELLGRLQTHNIKTISDVVSRFQALLPK